MTGMIPGFSKHPVYGRCVARGIRGGERFYMFIDKGGTVSLMPAELIDSEKKPTPKISVYDSPSGEFVAEVDRWRELARNEGRNHCSDPKCDCRSL